MGHSQNHFLTQPGWIHELAHSELLPEAEKLLQKNYSFDPQQLIEESTIQFLTELKASFDSSIKLFNGYSEGNTRFQEIKLYSSAQKVADFMLFRNQVKLIFSNTAHGIIQITFSHHLRAGMGVDGQTQRLQPSSPLSSSSPLSQELLAQELLAQIGPFRDVFWTYQGEKITPDQVAKFYLIEFCRATRDAKRSRGNHQLLLHQIKTLLEEKGFDL
jgi:hypothetical protein